MAKVQKLIELLQGTYHLASTTVLVHNDNGLKLIIGKNYKSASPEHVLLYHNTTTNKRSHLSLLYPVEVGRYCFDRAGVGYELQINYQSGIAEVDQSADAFKYIKNNT